jgi:hypothetical protein
MILISCSIYLHPLPKVCTAERPVLLSVDEIKNGNLSSSCILVLLHTNVVSLLPAIALGKRAKSCGNN